MKHSFELFICIRSVCLYVVCKHKHEPTFKRDGMLSISSPSLFTIGEKKKRVELREEEEKKVELSSVFKQWCVYPVKIKFGCSQ